MARHIAFVQKKGGSGKTALVRELSAYLAAQGKRVLAVDVDPNLSLSSNARVGEQMERSQLGLAAIEYGLDSQIVQHGAWGFDVIVCGGDEEDFKGFEHRDPRRVDALLKMVEPYEQDYDFIFYDVQGGLGFWAVNALSAAHFVIAPVDGYDGAHNAKKVKDFVPEGIGFGVVVNQLKRNEALYGDVLLELDALGMLTDVIGDVRHTTLLGQAPSQGPLVLRKPGNRAAVELMELGDWIVENVAVELEVA